MKRAALAVALLALTSAGASWAASQGQRPRTSRETVGVEAGYRPPSFAALDLTGQPHTLKDYEGRVLVLHFWASWCPYCRGEIAELTELHNTWQEKGVRVLAVSTDEDIEALRQFVKAQRLPYPVIADANIRRSIAGQYGLEGIPVTFILTQDGHIALRLDGASDIIAAVQGMLATFTPA